MSKHTDKASRRRSALERKATQHHDFVGQAEPERAEAEQRKHERVEEERNKEVVREMAAELEQAAGVRSKGQPGDGALGPEIPFRLPRSIDEGKRLIREAPEVLRDKARERLEKLPEPAQKALRAADTALQILLIPARMGLQVAREILRAPAALLRTLRHREA